MNRYGDNYMCTLSVCLAHAFCTTFVVLSVFELSSMQCWQELMQMRDPHLVAHYVAKLSQEDQVTLYSEFLTDITDTDEQELALTAAEFAGLDIGTITKTVVEKIR